MRIRDTNWMMIEQYLTRDVLDSLATHGFKRILIVNGHGGNAPVGHFLGEWMADHPDVKVKFHNWWNAPKTWAKVMEIDPVASHASWMENFRATRIAGVVQPTHRQPAVDNARLKLLNPRQTREYLGDGNFAGMYEKPDAVMEALWKVAVEETRTLIERGWGEAQA